MQLNGGEEKKKGEMQFGFAHREMSLREVTLSSFYFFVHSHSISLTP